MLRTKTGRGGTRWADTCPECGSAPVVRRGRCAACHARHLRRGTTDTLPRLQRPPAGTCSVTDCDRTVRVRTPVPLCHVHYMRQQRGIPLGQPVRKSPEKDTKYMEYQSHEEEPDVEAYDLEGLFAQETEI